MGCQDYEILIQKAIDGRLDAQECAALSAHLNCCPDCDALFDDYKKLDSVLKMQLPAVAVPEDLKEKVMDALPVAAAAPAPVADLPKAKRSRRWMIPCFGGIAAAAALLLAAGLTGWFEDTSFPDTQLPVADNDQVETIPSDPTDPEAVVAQLAEDELDPAEEQTEAAAKPESVKTESAKEEAITYSGGVMMPHVAHGSSVQGSYSLYTLVAHEDYDAILPRIYGNIVTYYIVADGYYLEWEIDLSQGSTPSYVGETESLPSEAGIAGFSDLSGSYGYRYISATAPDGMYQAVQRGGDNSGLWLTNIATGEELLADANGGGSLLSWAPDSNKVLYTRGDGTLHVYYPDQQTDIQLSQSRVSYLCWAPDSRAVVFSAHDSNTGMLSLFSVTVP